MKQMIRTMELVSMCVALTTGKLRLGGRLAAVERTQPGRQIRRHRLAAEWPEGGPKLAWQASGFGAGYSTISVARDRLYTMGDKGGAGWVTAASADGGKILWSTKVSAEGAPGVPGYDFPGPRSTPTVDGDLVFSLDAWGGLVCLNAADGKEQWRRSLVKDLGGEPPTWGYSESPLVDGSKWW